MIERSCYDKYITNREMNGKNRYSPWSSIVLHYNWVCENKIGELESLFYWIGSNHELRFNKKHFIGIGSFIQIEQHEICTQTIQWPHRYNRCYVLAKSLFMIHFCVSNPMWQLLFRATQLYSNCGSCSSTSNDSGGNWREIIIKVPHE